MGTVTELPVSAPTGQPAETDGLTSGAEVCVLPVRLDRLLPTGRTRFVVADNRVNRGRVSVLRNGLTADTSDPGSAVHNQPKIAAAVGNIAAVVGSLNPPRSPRQVTGFEPFDRVLMIDPDSIERSHVASIHEDSPPVVPPWSDGDAYELDDEDEDEEVLFQGIIGVNFSAGLAQALHVSRAAAANWLVSRVDLVNNYLDYEYRIQLHPRSRGRGFDLVATVRLDRRSDLASACRALATGCDIKPLLRDLNTDAHFGGKRFYAGIVRAVNVAEDHELGAHDHFGLEGDPGCATCVVEAASAGKLIAFPRPSFGTCANQDEA